MGNSLPILRGGVWCVDGGVQTGKIGSTKIAGIWLQAGGFAFKVVRR